MDAIDGVLMCLRRAWFIFDHDRVDGSIRGMGVGGANHVFPFHPENSAVDESVGSVGIFKLVRYRTPSTPYSCFDQMKIGGNCTGSN